MLTVEVVMATAAGFGQTLSQCVRELEMQIDVVSLVLLLYTLQIPNPWKLV
jgi:hypothetical protein